MHNEKNMISELLKTELSVFASEHRYIDTFYLSFHPVVHFLSVHVFLQFLLLLFPLHQCPPLYSSLLPLLLSSFLTSSSLLISFFLFHSSSSLSLYPFLYPLHHLIDLHLFLYHPTRPVFIYFICIFIIIIICIYLFILHIRSCSLYTFPFIIALKQLW